MPNNCGVRLFRVSVDACCMLQFRLCDALGMVVAEFDLKTLHVHNIGNYIDVGNYGFYLNDGITSGTYYQHEFDEGQDITADAIRAMRCICRP